jgi:hypothetical protein
LTRDRNAALKAADPERGPAVCDTVVTRARGLVETQGRFQPK